MKDQGHSREHKGAKELRHWDAGVVRRGCSGLSTLLGLPFGPIFMFLGLPQNAEHQTHHFPSSPANAVVHWRTGVATKMELYHDFLNSQRGKKISRNDEMKKINKFLLYLLLKCLVSTVV